MKKLNPLYRLFSLAVVALLSLLMPQTASAKWSKAASAFSYDGVSVKVTDRHLEIGAMYDTYGYATYKNHNDSIVTVNWKCYGVLKNGAKLVCVEEDSFVLAPGETRNEVYSYNGGKFTHRDFRTYVIAIEVVKEKAVTPDVPDAVVRGEIVTDDNEAEVYRRVMKNKNANKVTQKDFADGINWMDFIFTNRIIPISESGNPEKMQREFNRAIGDRWALMGDFLTQAYELGLMNASNKFNFEMTQETVAQHATY